MKILIATHKEKPALDNDLFLPIQVNAEKNASIQGVELKDNTGDHISLKNDNYSELTALYWMWKNLKQEDVLGLFHYRRFLNTYQNPIIKPHRIIDVDVNSTIIQQLNNDEEKSKRNINRWLKKHEVITSFPQFFKIREEGKAKENSSLKDDYYAYHIPEHWDELVAVVKEKYPEYEVSIQKYFYESNKIIGANMFISKYEWMDAYCHWLFDILFEVEQRVEVPEDAYQKRVFGFMSERLMSLYIFHNRFKVKYIQRLHREDLF